MAILFLILLAFIIPTVLELLNLLLTDKINWRAMLQTVQRDAFGQGLMVTGMLVTTLIPTLLHMIMGLGAIFMALSPNTAQAYNLIKYTPGSNDQEPMSIEDMNKVCNAYNSVVFWYIPATILTVGLFVGLASGYAYFAHETFGELLKNIALCGTYWSGHGRCGWW